MSETLSLDELEDHFVELYGRRNNVYLPGRMPRINLLNIAIGDLQDTIRKDVAIYLPIAFARVPSRIFCIANGINNVSIVAGMAEKYPLEACAYCGKFPCACKERRDDPKLDPSNLNPEQLTWN